MLDRSLIASAILLPIVCWKAPAAEPIHRQFDERIAERAKSHGLVLADRADDSEFLRRISLDLTGSIPSPAAIRKFVEDSSAQKRERLIDQLLASNDFPRHMSEQLHIALMERLGDHPDWMQYLEESIRKNKPWDRMAREILRADSKDSASKGAAFFIAKRLENYGQNPVDYSGLTRDVGRLFLGKNFQCAECHDHLFIDEYKQSDFQGLHAFLRNSFLVDAKTMQLAEKPTTDKLSFASVFTKVEMQTAPALPGGRMLELPRFEKGDEFAEKPDRKTNNPGVPRFSTLAALSEQLPSAKNSDFSRNMVNRIWFQFMGRGLVHPLDLHHSKNPPSHPEVLELLATEFVRHQFDLKWLIRELVLSETYQRSSRLPTTQASNSPELFAVAMEKRLSAEQMLAMICQATGSKPSEALRAKFLKAYANQPRDPEDEISPSLKATLFLLHDKDVLAMFQPRAGNLVERLSQPQKPALLAEELYLSILSRRPTAAEIETVTQILDKHVTDRAGAIGRMAWALVASTEFGVNH